MRVICVDGDEEALERAASLCRAHPAVDEVVSLARPRDALIQIRMGRTDLVLMDIRQPEIDGLELAAKLRNLQPSVGIIFLTQDPSLALEAFAVHPQSYLIKPLEKKTLEKEIDWYLSTRSLREISHIEIKTFGNFEITVDGSGLNFKRTKSKELLALLVDKQGAGISRMQAITELWEDREYDRRSQKYFDNILRSLMETLRERQISEILEVRGGLMRIRPELVDCDRYRFTMGDSSAINAYQGIYMYGYSWASWNGDFFG